MAKKRKTKVKARAVRSAGSGNQKRRCGLCGKAKRVQQTECCGNWICDDEDSYVPFSFSRDSCSRNHHRYTLCGYHDAEGHAGTWQECLSCRDEFETEMYAYYGTNDYNFQKLANPPKFEPTLCAKCGRRIALGDGGYTQMGDTYACIDCSEQDIQSLLRGVNRSEEAGDDA